MFPDLSASERKCGRSEKQLFVLLKELVCLSLNGISIEQKESHGHRFIIVIPPPGWELARASSFSHVHSCNPDIS